MVVVRLILCQSEEREWRWDIKVWPMRNQCPCCQSAVEAEEAFCVM
tara:strand:+ start:747 stop:884 length:138 start_codon:yes stop_codon:yes gene_type:complete